MKTIASLCASVALGLIACHPSDETTSDGSSEEEGLAVATAALNDADVQPMPGTPGNWGVVATGGPSATAFLSKLDNPPLQLRAKLRSSQYTQVGEDSGLTYRYRLNVDSMFTPDLEVLPTGAYSGTAYAFHTAHGLLLPPSGLDAVTLMRDNWDASPASEGTSHFALHPDVNLVPVRVVELYADPGTLPGGLTCPAAGAPHCGYPGWIGEKESRVVFDDEWLLNVDPTSNPFETPQQIVATKVLADPCDGRRYCDQPPATQPDDVFASCNVQFRMIDFDSCEVPSDVFTNNRLAAEGGCDENTNVFDINDAVQACAGSAKAGVITVVYVGSLINPRLGCSSGGIQQIVHGLQRGQLTDVSGANVYVTSYGQSDPLTLSHEIGHAVISAQHTTIVGNLMNPDEFNDGPALTAGQCASAISKTEVSHAYWP